jgi:hypothetical protein
MGTDPARRKSAAPGAGLKEKGGAVPTPLRVAGAALRSPARTWKIDCKARSAADEENRTRKPEPAIRYAPAAAQYRKARVELPLPKGLAGTVNLGSAYRSKAHWAERCSAMRLIMQRWRRR